MSLSIEEKKLRNRELAKKYYHLHKEYYKKKALKWNRFNPRCHRERKLKLKFNITLNQYNELHKNQNGLCAICRNPETTIIKGKGIALAVDHCHLTKRIRGLLCIKCNMGIGSFKDDRMLLQAAINYLSS